MSPSGSQLSYSVRPTTTLIIMRAHFIRAAARLAVAVSLFATVARAQQANGALIFGRSMEKRFVGLAKDPGVAAKAPGKTGLALMQAAGDSALYFVDDETLRDLGDLFAASGSHAPAQLCAQLYLSSGDSFQNAFMGLLAASDSALADRWADLMTRVTRAGILRPPLGRIASADEVTLAFQSIVAGQSTVDRLRLRRGASKTGSPEDICFFTVTTYRGIAHLPLARGGPVMRAMLRGVKPRLPLPAA